MDHACHQCGIVVTDGVLFCRECKAPQIRVVTVSPALPSPEIELQVSHELPTAPPRAIQWSQGLPATASAGVVGAILMFSAPGSTFGLGMVVSGFLAVVLYRRRQPATELTPGMGARLGVACGAWGFGIFLVIAAIAASFAKSRDEIHGQVLSMLAKSAVRTDPQTQQVMEYLKSSEGIIVLLILGAIVSGVAFLIFSTIGGAIGATVLGRKRS